MQIHTRRLILREFRLEDGPAFGSIQNDPRMFVYEPGPPTADEVRQKLERWVGEQTTSSRQHFALALALPPEDRLRGWLTLNLNFAETRDWEIGWMIEPACWGHGYAVEAARALLQAAFTILSAHRVIAFCHAGNRASERVMEKAGMTCEGRLRQARLLRGEWIDELLYAILEGELAVD